MALSREACNKAFYLFRDIISEGGGRIKSSWIADYEKEEDKFITDYMIGIDRKADDGWENVFINVKDITPGQLRIWNERKREIPNSSFEKAHPKGITRIGFF